MIALDIEHLDQVNGGISFVDSVAVGGGIGTVGGALIGSIASGTLAGAATGAAGFGVIGAALGGVFGIGWGVGTGILIVYKSFTR